MSLESTLFPVKEIPAVGRHLDEIDNNELYPTILDNTGYKFIVREDTNEVLSCMTNEYKLIKNEEILMVTKNNRFYFNSINWLGCCKFTKDN